MLQNHTAEGKEWSDLIEAGRQTRFGSQLGPCPSKTAKKYNYRTVQSIARRMGAAPVPKTVCAGNVLPKEMLVSTYPSTVEITSLHYMVAQMFAMALNGNVKMQHRLEIIIDGPL